MVTVFRRKNKLLFALEAALSVAAVGAGMELRTWLSAESIPFDEALVKASMYVAIFLISIYLTDLYHVHVMVNRRHLLPRMARATGVAVLLYALLNVLVPERIQGRVVFVGSLVVLNAALIVAYAIVARLGNHRAFLERVLVLGDSSLAALIRDELASGVYRQKLIDDRLFERRVVKLIEDVGRGLSEARRELEELGRHVDIIVLALENVGWQRQRVLSAGDGKVVGSMESGQSVNKGDGSVGAGREQGDAGGGREDAFWRGLIALKLTEIPMLCGLDYYEHLSGRVYLGTPTSPIFFSQSDFQIAKLGFVVKSVWERFIAAIIFVVSIPFLILVPIAIYLDTGRPLFFVQKRVGRGGKVYKLYKWRSMDDKGNITRVGRIIRRTKLDELPQLFNVLRGEMALVGPRPEMPDIAADFERIEPYYQLRHMVRPGLSGWAQIMFPDARAKDAMTKLSYDLYYVKNFSLVSDLVIMLETVKMIVFGGVSQIMRKAQADAAPGRSADIAASASPPRPACGGVSVRSRRH